MDFNNLDNLQASLDLRGVKVRAEIFEFTESTNTLAKNLLEQKTADNPDFCQPFAVVAKEQTDGRGRFTRRWISQKDASICLSVALPISVKSKAIESVTIRAGAEICAALRSAFAANVFLKWPNDIYSEQGKKICGILADFIPAKIGGRFHWVVLGVGLNFDFSKLTSPLPDDVSKICTDLKSQTENKNFGLCSVAAEIIKASAVAAQKTENFAADLPELFETLDWLKGKKISVRVCEDVFCGTADGTDFTGKLILKTGGAKKLIPSGEATLLK